MNTRQKWILGGGVFLSVSSFVFAIIALCKTCYRGLGFDYIGVIVGVLTILVTTLLGWQIYNAIEIKKKVRKALLKTERIEKTLRYDLNKIEDQVKESRFLANSVIKFLKAQQNLGYNDKTLFYLDTLVTLKYLLLSNIRKLKLEGENELYEDCLFDLDGCIQDLEKEQNKIIVRLFNNYHSLCDELYSSIFSILDDPQYQMEDIDKRFFQDMNRRRRELLKKYGGITDEEVKEINRKRTESAANQNTIDSSSEDETKS